MHKKAETVSTKTVNEQFDKYKEGFVIDLWKLNLIGQPVKDTINWTAYWSFQIINIKKKQLDFRMLN
jgi:hypothetical protein